MSYTDWGITAGLIALLSFLFDIIDLQPQVGSMGFLRTFVYLPYLILRVFLGIIAALIVFTLEPSISIPILALIAVAASITILQSFTISVGGSDLAKIAPLMENYKNNMTETQATRTARKKEAAILRITDELKKHDPSFLEGHLRAMLLPTPPDQINEMIEQIQKWAKDDVDFQKTIYARRIVERNREWAQRLARENPPQG